MGGESTRHDASKDGGNNAQATQELGGWAENAGAQMEAGGSVGGGQPTGGDRVRIGILDLLSLNDVMEECLGQKAECVPHEGRSILRFSIQFSGPRAIPGIESALRKSLSSK